MPKEKLNEDHIEIIKSLRSAGHTIKETAQQLGVVHTTLRRFMRRHGLSTAPLPVRVRLPSEEIQKLCERYSEGESLSSLKRYYGFDYATIKKILVRNGIEPRKKWARNPSSVRAASLDIELVKRQYEEGATLEKLAADHDVCSSTIRSRLLESGVELRSRGPARKSPEKILDTKLRRLYGLTLDQYNELLAKQEDGCAICGVGAGDIRNHGKSVLCVDHDHDTERVRGLLCHTCNLGVSYFNDGTQLLRQAGAYLEHAADS